MKRIQPLLSAALTLLPMAVTGQSASLGEERPFPLSVDSSFGSSGLRLVPGEDRASTLPDEDQLRLTGVPWPAPRAVEAIALNMKRWHVLSPDFEWFLDGELVGGRDDVEAHARLYVGTVDGDTDSHAYIALTSTGAWGWIRRGSERVHLFSTPEDGDWSDWSAYLMREDDAVMPSPPSPTCATTAVGGATSAAHVQPDDERRIWEALLALETDYQFYQLFGDPLAATNYAVALFGAVSERYLSAASTLIKLPYLGIYSDANDPWTRQDNGAPMPSVLRGFRLAWGGKPLPGNAHLAHMLSGAKLGGGLAYIDKLCSRTHAFALSADLHGMLTFPVAQAHNLNWDLMVAAHETGHVFGSVHTHEYCPPIDQCVISPTAPPGCQGTVRCQKGTIMSYCHLCGGVENMRMDFHPRVGDLMRARVSSSCLPSSVPAMTSLRNGTGVNPTGYRSRATPKLGATWWATVDLKTNGVASVVAAVAASPVQGDVQPFGELLIDLTKAPALPMNLGQGSHLIVIPNDRSLSGLTLATQAAVVFPGGFQLQNAIDVTVGF